MMKQLLGIYFFVLLLFSVGCSNDDNSIDLELQAAQLEQLCLQMNTDILSLQTIVTSLQTQDYVTNVNPITENGKTIGYTIAFAKALPIIVYHNEGSQDCYIPRIGVKKDINDIYYWTLDGEWLSDVDGKQIKAQESNEGVSTPRLKIENFVWYVSYDNGVSWMEIGKTTDEVGEEGQGSIADEIAKSFFRNVTQDEKGVNFTLTDGTVISALNEESAIALYFQDGVVYTMQKATIGRGIDVVLMGDGYSRTQIIDGTYRRDMELMHRNFFTVEPYASFKDRFNVYYVNVISESEGFGNGETALGGFFGDGTRVGGDNNACFAYAKKAISDSRMDEVVIAVAMNSTRYSGTCYMFPPVVESDCGAGMSVSYFSKGSDSTAFICLLHHEALGHGFPKLGDEYAYQNNGTIPESNMNSYRYQQQYLGWWKNVDFTIDANKIKWSHFLFDERYKNENIGIYEGGLTYWSGVYRSTSNSIMRNNTGGFNAQSREAIYYRIHKLAHGNGWVYDFEDFVKYDEINRKSDAATRAASHELKGFEMTHPPVVMPYSWRESMEK